MNRKNIRKSLKFKLDYWLKTIDNENIVKTIKENALVTGGAIVSLLNNEQPNDYDIYFKTKESCFAVAEYYAKKWKELDCERQTVNVCYSEDKTHVECKIQSNGALIDDGESAIDDPAEKFFDVDQVVSENKENLTESNPEIAKPQYRPRYFSTNAISLSDGIQLVIRFCGPVEEIHKNYDFVHTTCSYDYKEDVVNLPAEALECIINKELKYQGSKFPLCSIIRTRKFIERGWHINAGQYVKMAMQLNDMDLKDFNTFKEQLTGVDSAYFNALINVLSNKYDNNTNFSFDTTYVIELIDKIF